MTDDDEASGADPVKAWQAALRAAPFHNWLDLDIVALSGDSLELAMPWRDEIVSNPRIGSVHGGIGLADRSRGVLRPAGSQPSGHGDRYTLGGLSPSGDRWAHLHVVEDRQGWTAMAESTVRSAGGDLYASGRGMYLTGE